jgi:uncharacterized membrane protein
MKPLKRIIDFKYKSLYMISIAYIFIAMTLGIFLQNGLVIFLGWNMALATFPLVLSHIIIYQKSKFLRLGIVFLFIIFFPNAMYIMTDFIHFQNYTYFIEYPEIYAFQIKDWIVFTHLVIGALLAGKIGIIGLQILINDYRKILNIKKYLLINGLFMLSSIALFIGRFLRYNSWEIFKIHIILANIANHFQFFLQFILLSFIMHWIIYYVFHEKKEPMAQIK